MENPIGNYSNKENFIFSKVYYANTHHLNLMLRLCVKLAGKILWKYKSQKSIKILLSKYAQFIEDEHGVSKKTQKKNLIDLAAKLKVQPFYYYKYRLFESNNTFDNLLYNTHYIPLFSRLFRNNSTKLISNKYLFDRELSSVINDRVKNIAVVNKQGISFFNKSRGMPNCDLFIKPVNGSAGRKCMQVKYVDKRFHINNQLQSLNSIELNDFIIELGREEPMLIQEYYKNHSNIAHLSNGALASNRINTYVDKQGDIQVLFSMFLMPIGQSFISNGSGGSILTKVDLLEGTLGKGIKMNNPNLQIINHPDTNQRIEGTVLPNWNKAKFLCRKGHELFKDIPFIGWDICYINEGPKILEANLNWSIEAWQITHDNFDKLFFQEILEFHIKRYFNE